MRFLHVISLLAFTAPLASQAIPVDSIVALNTAARGGLEAIRAIETLVYRNGTYSEGDFTSDGGAFMAFRRPYLRVVGNPEEAGGFMEGYDGAAWEWWEEPGVVIRTVGAAGGATRRGADFEGPLLDYRAKGSTVEQLPATTVDGRPAWHLRLTTMDGFRRDYLVDQATHLVVAERRTAPLHAEGEPITTESRVSDYRRVGGVLFAHRYVETEIGTGRPISSMQWGTIEANRDLPQTWFHPPEFTRTPLQAHLELLYAQRTDADAVLWSMAAFRRAHPDIDMAGGLDFIGWQMQKMGSVETAIRVLEVNAEWHPTSASTHTALGRAYREGGRTAEARAAFERALVLDPENRRARAELEALAADSR